MLTVRLHTQAGSVWALFRCSACGEVQKRTLHDALTAPIPCKRCSIHLDIGQAVAEAADRDGASTAVAAMDVEPWMLPADRSAA